MVRLPPALVTIPNVAGAATFVPGEDHTGEFVRLNAYARSWKFNFSTGLKFLNSEKSRLC